MIPELQRILADNGGSGLKIESVKLQARSKKLLVSLQSDKLLRPAQVERIGMELKKLLPECETEARFSYPRALEEWEKDFQNAAVAALETLKLSFPSHRFALERAKTVKEGGVMTLLIPGAAEALFANGTASDMEACLKERYGLSVPLRIRADASIELEKPEPIKEGPRRARVIPAQRDKEVKGINGEQKTVKDVIIGKPIQRSPVTRMCDFGEDTLRVTVSGYIFSMDRRDIKDGSAIILTVFLTDNTNTVPVKLYLDQPQSNSRIAAKLEKAKKDGDWLMVRGTCYQDQYLHEMCINPLDINIVASARREDRCEHKRVELHLHTQLSAMDALTKPAQAVMTAARWGHPALAITDHGVAHAFPYAADAAAKAGIKVIFGVEGYLMPDSRPLDLNQRFTAVTITAASGLKEDFVFEIAAKRITGDLAGERFYTLVNPGAPLPAAISEKAGITAKQIADAPSLKEAFSRFYRFLGDDIPVVPDAPVLKTLVSIANRFNCTLAEEHINIGILAGYLYRNDKQALSRIVDCAESGGAALKAESMAAALKTIVGAFRETGTGEIPLMLRCTQEKQRGHGHHAHHIILLAQNHEGLKNLYRLVSYAHLDHFKGVPRIPRSLLMMHRTGLILGSACESGELFKAVTRGADEKELTGIAQWYDYLEIQPIMNNAFMLRNGTAKDEEALRDFNRRIVALGETLGKPVVATGDVHFLNPEDAQYRKILMHSRGFQDAEAQPPLYFKTTEEMLEEFSYLGEDKALEVVVRNPNAIADRCEKLKPFLSEKRTYAPKFEGADAELRSCSLQRAEEIYGAPLPQIVRKRLDKELHSIISNGYSSLYLMARRLVQKSLSDGYLVGSRGSVGSSFVATMAGITEVNPLPPHYICPGCKHSEFNVPHTGSSCGIDLPDAVCPVCGSQYLKDGYEIPFETFLGFKGDKTPDIDLNFSGEYQSSAHRFTETMFGEGHAFRAGTISAIQDKTVYGYVRAYCEEKNKRLSKMEMNRLVSGCSGVKKTTGQHPGGIVIVPAENDIMEFTPIQHPADKSESDTITTHFDFHALDDRLVKLDILGHDDPTALKMLGDLTGLNPREIALNDVDTMALFSNLSTLNINLDKLQCDVGSLGIPEFGTGFVRQMLMDTRPTTMEELVRISGLSHGTDVWLSNAQTLVLNGTATLSEAICTRDDIMNYLIANGCEPSISFKTMESVRKGKGLTPEMEAAMREKKIPEWYIDSCKKIKYMFPRAHAAAYVMMAFRVAYYKVHFPLEFYTVYYTVRADDFDIEKSMGGAQNVLKNIMEIRGKGKENIDAKEQSVLTILEIVYEMNLRGFELLPVDIYSSEATRFKIENGFIRPPFSSIPGVGANAAEALARARAGGRFASIEDFQTRSKANTAVMGLLRKMGCLNGLPETNQISLF